jgi:hypothetical protein
MSANGDIAKLLWAALKNAAHEPAHIDPLFSDHPLTFIEADVDLQKAAMEFLAAVKEAEPKPRL